jgi:ribosomal protein S11
MQVIKVFFFNNMMKFFLSKLIYLYELKEYDKKTINQRMLHQDDKQNNTTPKKIGCDSGLKNDRKTTPFSDKKEGREILEKRE